MRLLVDGVVDLALEARDDAVDLRSSSRSTPRPGREMMSGVRASSIRIESTSSTIA